MFNVLFVCIGNVCRSPLAERLLALRLVQAEANESYAVASAGVRAMKGRGMHPESARTCVEFGGNPEGFVSRQLTAPIVAESGLILTATRDVRSSVLEEMPQAMRRTFTVTEFAALAEADLAHGSRRAGGMPAIIERCSQARGSVQMGNIDIDDPIGRSTETFNRVAGEIDEVVYRLARILAREAEAQASPIN